MSSRHAAPAVAMLLLLAGPGIARAQAVCSGHTIREIRVLPSSLFGIESTPFPSFFQTIGNGFNWQTRPATVRRELRFAEGDPCDAGRLAESARVLRAQPYLRSAEITTTPAPGGAVDVEVQTRDEWALSGSIRIGTEGRKAVKAARLTEDNLFGLGMGAQLRYDYFGRRAGLVADLLHRQVMGRNDAELVLGRTSVGSVAEVSMRRTFESEYDRIAWRAALRWRKEPFIMKSVRYGTVTQPLVSAGLDVGIARRSGPVGRQMVVGVALAVERQFADGTVLASLPASDSAATAQVAGRFAERRRAALNLFWGYRNVRFIARTGIDAVNAPEDVREGFEFRLIGGRSVATSSGFQRDWFALADGYAGAQLGRRTLGFVRARAEGRYRPDQDRWDGVIAAADVFTFTAVSPRGVIAVGAQAAGGWNTSTPFQLLLASETALRGFGLADVPAGRRVVVQAEHRYFLGTMLGALDAGSAAFVDVGRGWAGDAAFGTNSGTLVSIGAGLRIGFPSGSRFATRLDVALPVRGGVGAEFRVTVRRQFGVMSPEPSDIERSRIPVANIDLFNFSRY